MKSSVKSVANVAIGEPKYLTLTDLSVYNTDIPVTNAIYRITLPNFNAYVDVPYTPNTTLNVNSNLLNLTASWDDAGLCWLPGGLYTIRQSICPNDKLFYEYHFFNIIPQLKEIADKVCANLECEDAIDRLWDLKKQLELAKVLAEECCKVKEGVALYNTAAKAIANFDCTC